MITISTKSRMKITVVGGGNIGTQFAVHAAEAGHEVVIYTSSPDLYDGYLRIVNEDGYTTHEGTIKHATNDPKTAFNEAELIMVTVPATMMRTIANLVFLYGSSSAYVGVVPGNGGSECAFRNCIERGNTFFAIERVPAIARLIEKGHIVKSTGYRKELHVSAIPGEKKKECAEIVKGIFKMKCETIPCMLNLTMTPSNPILHTARLYSLFKDWHDGVKYAKVPLFYEEWDDNASRLLLSMDNEEQEICHKMPEVSFVKSLRDHYEASTVTGMTRKIRSIPAFRGLSTPVTNVSGGVIPDLHSRYFTSDFSYGLGIIQQIGKFARVDTPVIDMVMNWYRKIAVEKDEFRFEEYGITDLSGIRAFYLR